LACTGWVGPRRIQRPTGAMAVVASHHYFLYNLCIGTLYTYLLLRYRVYLDKYPSNGIEIST
jgi:hypothetical protein